jgi:PAS domain S-box-containing protein
MADWQRLACATVLACLTVEAAWAQETRVVLLYDERVELPGLVELDARVSQTLATEAGAPLEIYRESMDLSRFDRPGYAVELRDHLRAKYAATPISLVVAVRAGALHFVLDHGELVFPGAPIVFCGLDRRELGERPLPPNVTGVFVRREFRPTLETALRLHPNTRHVVVVGGTQEFDGRVMRQAREEFREFHNRLAFTYLTDLPMAELRSSLAKLPPRTIVFLSTMFRDGAGQPFDPQEAAEAISAAANAPVYGIVDQYVGRGIVGGHVYNLNTRCDDAARVAVEVLAGRPPTDFPPRAAGTMVSMFDWRQVVRWNIDERSLPAGSEVRFKVPTLWDQYRPHLVGAIAFGIAQAVIIVLLVAERSARRQSEKRHALASAAGGTGVWDWDLQTDEFYLDAHLEHVLGYEDRQIHTLAQWSALVHPEDTDAVMAQTRDAIAGSIPVVEIEYRMVHRNGDVRWFLTRGSVVRRHGRPVRMTGTSTDITDRKLTALALEDARHELDRVSRLATLGEFAASIAHEVRQPLTAIIVNANASLRRLGDPTIDPELHEALTEIVDAGRRADALVQHNRELFRQRTVQKEPVDMNEIVREVETLARSRLEAGQIVLTTALELGAPTVRGDRIELQQVLLNLLLNAIEATQEAPGGKRRIEISTSGASRGVVTVAVRDNGVGFKHVDMQRLFSMSYTTKPTGTGIGLSLSRSIVQAHGGRLWAQQNAESGATFTFTIPVSTEAAAHKPRFASTG